MTSARAYLALEWYVEGAGLAKDRGCGGNRVEPSVALYVKGAPPVKLRAADRQTQGQLITGLLVTAAYRWIMARSDKDCIVGSGVPASE